MVYTDTKEHDKLSISAHSDINQFQLINLALTFLDNSGQWSLQHSFCAA